MLNIFILCSEKTPLSGRPKQVFFSEWRSVFCKQMPSQTLDGSSYPSYEFGGKFKNSYKKVNFLTFSNLNFRVFYKKMIVSK